MLESLFREVYNLYKNPRTETFKRISSSVAASEIKVESSKPFPKMTSINKALKIPEIWQAVLVDLKVDPKCENIAFPDFVQSLLYGIVSDVVHNPDITSVILSDKSSVQYRIFFECFGDFFGVSYKEFIEEMTESIPDEFKV